MTEITNSVKIQPRHLDRLAIVYVRQSHPQQQIKHPESVATQRRLRERIQQGGWPSDRIRVLDGDLGKSGTSTVGRHDFAWLVSEVTLKHVGLVAGFQINRLAREDETSCHLIKICSLFDTLLADQDGLYHPQDFNDRLAVADKRRVVQLLLEKAVVTGSGNELVQIELHGTGGTVTHHEVTRRLRRWKSLSHYEALVGEVEKLASGGLRSGEIARRLNAAGYRTCRASEFTAEAVRQLRSRNAAPRTAG